MTENSKHGLSIIIANFNSEQFIAETLDSVLSQTRLPNQVVIVDDCSIDDSLIVIEKFIQLNTHVNFKLIKNKTNLGQAYSRNIGINESDYEYFCFLDSDDILSPFFIERMFSAAIETKADLVYCDFKLVSLRNKAYKNYAVKFEDQITSDCGTYLQDPLVFLKDYLIQKKSISFVTFLISKRYFFRESLFFNEHLRYGEDDLFLISLLNQTPNLYFLDCELYFYIRRPNSITTSSSLDKIKPYLESIDHEIQVISKTNTIDEADLNMSFIRRLIGVLRMVSKHESDYSNFINLIKIWKNKVRNPFSYGDYRVVIFTILILFSPRSAYFLSKLLPG
jgi:glycosyltransferase involved in cell wall biosynthesis